ncbi:hypothetical protein [Deinococcus maricopensis]|uniref:Uncharacterized protein n=1 Tax=Deinococcus maricopensis (strain DSM 21211 / LMG 22137 / NRRL B-23946 / LB-34) TaxID=709986 RepID=E8U8F7_DEIML|nr:hypothetical protein [Deinococcus maricopensis]ADV67346.1 hypothetical protein Deima_1697 [Deinococcus maricopensis DSM 21211]
MHRTVATALLAASALAGATSVRPLTFAQQARQAEVIVRATVGAGQTVTEDGLTWTVYPLTVAETIAGNAADLPRRGDQPALYILNGVDDAPTFKAGAEAVLLLYKARLDSPIVGFNAGLYPVEDGKVTRGDTPDLAAFKTALLKAREAQ